jgi:hypothetical protein
MPTPELQTVESLLAWLRLYFAVCALTYIAVAGVGGWYAATHRENWKWILPAMGVAYAAGVSFHWSFTNDDSFIFYRYAEHLASGIGPAYNPGVNCEGFTSTAWTYILAFGNSLGASPIWLSKILGACFGAVAILAMILTVRRICDDARVVFLTSLAITTSQALLAWIPSGMDTALFVAWLSVWVYVFVRNPDSLAGLLLLAALGAWIRPEAYIIVAVGTAWNIYAHRSQPGFARRIAFAGLIAVVVILPIVWRFSTFGEFLPTTFYAKSDRSLRSGLGFLFGAINGYGAAVWAVALFGLWRLRRVVPWAGIMVVAIAGYIIWVGGDVLIQRFSLWWMPLVVLGLAAGLREIAQTRLLDAKTALCVIALLLTGQELHRMYSVTRPGSENDGYTYVSSNSVHTAEADVPIGKYLHAHGSPDDTVVTDNIGAIGYYSGMVIIDVLGLVDPEIASLIHDGDKGGITSLVTARRPRWIAGYEKLGTSSLQLPIQDALSQSFLTGYERVGRWQSRTGYTRILLKRKDLGPE